MMEGEMTVAKVEGWGYTKLEILTQTEFAQYTHVETSIPAVLVGRDEHLLLGSVLGSDGLRAYVDHFHILHVGSHEYTEMEWAQVGIRAVLDLAFLGIGSHRGYYRHQDNKDIFLHHVHHIIYIIRCYGALGAAPHHYLLQIYDKNTETYPNFR